jgi:pimeloyl-ACP methyl ester carboxylesterase
MARFVSDALDLFYIEVPATGLDRNEPVVLVHGFASNHAVNWLNTLWIRTLTEAGRRVIALDNRGHGASARPHDDASYHTARMARDVRNLLDHLEIEKADVLGYSMGARITAFLAASDPDRVRSAILGGLGIHLVDGGGLPQTIADAMEASSADDIPDATGRLFRRFAESTGSDLTALAACIRGSRQVMEPALVATVRCPVLVAVGTKDPIGGDPHALAQMLPLGRALDIPGRDHNLAVGDKLFKSETLAFLNARA